jgi:hypothetical protein
LGVTIPEGSSVSASHPAAPRTDGLGRVLITVYLILALAATLRAVYQIVAKFDEAPVAYSLSLASGLVYIVATIALMRREGIWRAIAWAALVFEFAGVLIVGALSLVIPEWFAHDSVWSFFGMNYFWIPLVLPVLGMTWLRRDARAAAQAKRNALEGSPA